MKRNTEEAVLRPDATKGWLVDYLIGGAVGGLLGAVVAVNFVILTGIDQGYEASLGEVFHYNLAAGLATVMILVAGPVLGIVVAWRLRQNRARRGQEEAENRDRQETPRQLHGVTRD